MKLGIFRPLLALSAVAALLLLCAPPSAACTGGSFSGVWANTRLCYRTGIRFDNTDDAPSTLKLCFSGAFCDPACISPLVFQCVEVTVPANGFLSKHVDEYFGLNRHSGSVAYTVESGPEVTTVRADTFNCSTYTFSDADTCD